MCKAEYGQASPLLAGAQYTLRVNLVRVSARQTDGWREGERQCVCVFVCVLAGAQYALGDNVMCLCVLESVG